MKTITITLINIYKRLLSPVFSVFLFGGCRYQPTCSQYAKQSIEKFGIIKGGSLSLKRVLRCHPWGGKGYDPLPLK